VIVPPALSAAWQQGEAPAAEARGTASSGIDVIFRLRWWKQKPSTRTPLQQATEYAQSWPQGRVCDEWARIWARLEKVGLLFLQNPMGVLDFH
jgi:hypothetical protein